jgi:integrating conjugative element relaxase (TIGR03760 family)
MSSSLIDAAAAVALGAGGLALIWRAHRRSRTDADDSLVQPDPPFAAEPGRPQTQLKILSSEELLNVTGTGGLVEVIRNRLALSEANWRGDALPVLEKLCDYVQLLPASESHHHAHPGGLLTHTLEVASYALTVRQMYKLPAGADPEEQVKKQALWSYAVLLAALLHDVGKPVSDVLVQVYGQKPHEPIGTWQALSGPMSGIEGASHYEIDFPSARNYRAHERLGVVLLHALVPPRTMRWLGSDPELLPALLGFLDGQDLPASAVLKEIVQKADSLSVAENLKSGPRSRFAKARQAPLIERLMWALRTLLAEGGLAVNRPGATIFIDPDGQHLWAVSATLAEKVRAVLNEREIRHEGAAAIPTDNTRLFDTWQEYGALITPSKEYGKGSVWWVRIDLPQSQWSQVLTVLKFKLSDLYPASPASANSAQPAITVPAPLPGTVTPVSPSTPRGQGSGNESAEVGDVDPHRPAAPDEAYLGPQASGSSQTKGAASAGAADAGEAVIEGLLASYGDGGSRPDISRASEYLEESESAPTASGLRVKPAVQALTIPQKPTPKNAGYGAQPRPDAEAFFAWIQSGLGNGDLSYNESDSVVHFTAEGMAIVSPRAFKLYLETHTYNSDLGQSKSPLAALQKDIQKGGYIQRNRKQKTSFHVYLVKSPSGTLSGGRLTTYVIPNPQAYIRPVPSPNVALVLDDEGVAEQASKKNDLSD